MATHSKGARSWRYFISAHVHRRLFVWFGAAIILSGVIVGLLMHTVWSEESWRKETERFRLFLGGRFERVWDDPAARTELAHALATQLDLEVFMLDGEGRTLGAFGPPCETPPWRSTVVRDGQKLGTVGMCSQRRHSGFTRRMLVNLGVVLVLLWAASSILARRLTRPLEEVARVARDIGAGKLKSRALLGRHEPDEVGLLADAINDMAARIERQMADQRELLAAVSHEIRTPLGHIRVLTDMARETGVTARTLDNLDREVNEIDTLVADLLARSRLDFAALTASRLNAVDLARQALERANEPSQKLVVEGTPGGVDVDPTLVGRALANMIDNARRHGGGLTSLRVGAAAGRVSWVVEDAGPGFPPGEETMAFEPFRVPPKHGKAESHGLGLSLVRRIAEAHGGRAWAANAPAGGARVGVEIPAAGS